MKYKFELFAAMAAIIGAALAIHFGDPDKECPRPSPASVEKLFAPCQAFETAIHSPSLQYETLPQGVLNPNDNIPGKIAAQQRVTVGLAGDISYRTHGLHFPLLFSGRCGCRGERVR